MLQETLLEDKVLDRIDALAEKLGVAAEHIWEILVQQAPIEAWSNIVMTVITLTFCFTLVSIGFHRNSKGVKWMSDDNESPSINGLITWIPLAIGVIMFVTAIFSASGWATQILNPEHYAWQQIQRLL